MITVILKHPAGRQFFPYGKTAQNSSAVICHKYDKRTGNHLLGVGCTTERGQIFFSEVAEANPEILWRAMFCASKVFTVNEASMKIAVYIAGGNPIDLAFLRKAKEYLSCDYTAESLREASFRQVIPHSDLKKILKSIKPHEFTSDEKSSEAEIPWEKRVLHALSHLREANNPPSLMA